MQKLAPNALEIGMITAEPVITPSGQVLAPEGSVVTRQLINRMKLYRIPHAVVVGESTGSGISIKASDAVSAPEPAAAPEKPVPEPLKKVPKTHAEESKTHAQKVAASSEFRDFQIQYLQAVDQMKVSFSATIRDNRPIDTEVLLSAVSNLFRSRNTIAELFDMIFNMRAVKSSVYTHCLNVALISRMLGRWLKLEHHDLDVLTLAGLLHDIGKLILPEELLNKPGALSDEEFAKIKEHPKLGYAILKRQDTLDSRIKKAALMHHERCDGSGYPAGLTEDFIDNYAMVVAIADVYDAMTSSRSYRSPMCPFEVIRSFERDGFQKYHTRYIVTFLQQIATTYQSNRVILSDGRGGNIVMINPHALSRPIVQFDDNTCLDLSTVSSDLYIKAVM